MKKRKYTIKKRNIIRLQKFLNKLEDGRHKDKCANSKEC